MKKYITVLIILLTIKSISAQDSPLTIPQFSIVDVDGNKFTNNNMSQDKNAYIVYFNPECGHCETAFMTLNFNYKNLINDEVIFYAVAANNKEKTLDFFNKRAPNILKLENLVILLDEDYVFADAFNVRGFPAVYFYNSKGEFVSRYDGADDVLKPLKDISDN